MLGKTLLSRIYFALAFIGTLLSWWYFMGHFQEANSILIGPFLKSATATQASTGVAVDAYFAGIVFAVMAVTSASKDRVKWPWAYVAICFLIGLCLALPLYLGMRERAQVDS